MTGRAAGVRPPKQGDDGACRAGRRVALLSLCGALPVLVGGCSVLGNPEPRQWYRLEDLAVPAARPAAAGGQAPLPVLLVEVVSSPALFEGGALVFSRAPGVLAHYSFANWAEPPGRRIGRLVERRLEARGRFASVGMSTSGLRADLLLRIALDELLHDVAADPDQARIALEAELIDWRRRARIGRRRFAAVHPVPSSDAAGAAAALSRALTAVLDEMAPWVEAAAGR